MTSYRSSSSSSSFLPCLILALPCLLSAHPFDYKLYYSQEIGILYDTKSKHIDILCKHLSNVIETIDDAYSCKHQSSILNNSKEKLTITIEARQYPTQRPHVTLYSKNKSFLKAARRLTTQYFFHFKELPPPPTSYQHFPPAYDDIYFDNSRERSEHYRLYDMGQEFQLRERANAIISTDDIQLSFRAETRNTVMTTRPQQVRRRFISHNGRLIPLPTRCPTYRESFPQFEQELNPS